MAEVSSLEKLFSWVSRMSEGRHFPVLLALSMVVSSLALAVPDWSGYDPDSQAWQTVELKSRELTNNLAHLEPGSWLAKKVFRLSIPLVMKLTGATPLVVLALQYLCGLLLLLFSYKLAARILRDSVSAVFFTAALAFTYFGRAAFFDVRFLWFDGIAYFMLLMALYCNRGWLVFLFASAAAWTDERAFLALALVMLFHLLKDGTFGSSDLPGVTSNKRFLAALAAAALYLAMRFWMQHEFGMRTPVEGAHWAVIRQTWYHLPLGAMTFLEGFWLAGLVFLIAALYRRDYALPVLTVAAFAVLALVAACVYDVTRSGSFAMPVVFITGSYLGRAMGVSELRWVYFSVFSFSLLFPPVFVCSDWGPMESLAPSVIFKVLNAVF